MLRVQVDRLKIKEFCQRNGITRLAIFGSAVRGDFDPGRSDVDVLVAFAPKRVPGYFGFVGMAEELEALFSRRVDLVTYDAIHPLLRDEILGEAEVQYDEAS